MHLLYVEEVAHREIILFFGRVFSFMIWATPKATKAERERVAEAKAKGEHATEKEDYFPVCHLFDIKQVHIITK